MKYLKVKEIAEKRDLNERTIRIYCENDKIEGAYKKGKTWFIPKNATKPLKKSRSIKSERNLLEVLKQEKNSHYKGGIYHKIQILMTYNSNHIEGSKLSEEETRFIFETKTIGKLKENLNIDDLIETSNHFSCVDLVIDNASLKLNENFIKKLHFILKNGTSDSRISWFNVGKYKLLENEIGGISTTPPNEVKENMKELLINYNSIKNKTIEDLIEFHYNFEKIHPFQDGNGRIGRLILFKECLKYNFIPIIIKDEYKGFYYNGLNKFKENKGYLISTFLALQEDLIPILDKFSIYYKK